MSQSKKKKYRLLLLLLLPLLPVVETLKIQMTMSAAASVVINGAQRIPAPRGSHVLLQQREATTWSLIRYKA
jgi:hypothetical protein